MFENGVNLTKNAWHSKYMKWIWGWDHEDFSNACPYTWLTMFNVLFFAIIIPIKIVVLTIISIATFVDNRETSNQLQRSEKMQELAARLYKNVYTNADFYFVLNLLERVYIYHNATNLVRSNLMLLFDSMPSEWRRRNDKWIHISDMPFVLGKEFGNKFWLDIHNAYEKTEKAHKVKKANAWKPTDMMKYAKPAVKIIVVLLFAYIAYNLILLCIWLYWNMAPADWLQVLKWTGIIIGGIGIIIGAFWLLDKLFSAMKVSGGKLTPYVANGFDKTIDFFGFLGSKIAKGWKIVYTIYTTHCPPINWKD